MTIKKNNRPDPTSFIFWKLNILEKINTQYCIDLQYCQINRPNQFYSKQANLSSFCKCLVNYMTFVIRKSRKVLELKI